MTRLNQGPNEIRNRVIAVLLQSEAVLGLGEIAAQAGIQEKQLRPVLEELVASCQVVEGRLSPDQQAPQYRWRARWESEIGRRTAEAKERLRGLVGAADDVPDERPGIDSPPVLAFHEYVINEYRPPEDKRCLVFLQCSVRRPFSTSPSQASMRRAISVATGYDPSNDFLSCPVHVVVLASTMGPVPYEFEDIHPANVGGGGVKHFSSEHYARVKPILAERMAAYVTAHRDCYDHITTFTDGRYGEVIEDAKGIAGVDFPVLPVPNGPRILRMGRSAPRTYWQKYWIQLYLEIVSWLESPSQEQAGARLKELDVRFDPGALPDSNNNGEKSSQSLP